MASSPTYYDFASTTPVDPRVLEEMLPYFSEIFGNASSNHIYGKQAKDAIEIARARVADLINADTKEIFFTSGATESINWALKGYLEKNSPEGGHIITVKTEHKAVLNTCEYLESKGYHVTYLKVNQDGLILLDELKASITPETKLVAVMYVNNEIGVIQNIAEIGNICRNCGVTFFTDATQAVGKIPVNVEVDNIDILAMSAHKFYGPKGVGSLYIRKGIKVSPLIHGGNQETGIRSGTYNTPLIVGMGKAAALCSMELTTRIKDANSKRRDLITVFENNGWGNINFESILTSPFILSFTLNNIDSQDFLIRVRGEIVASSGSACSSGLIDESHVLKAIGLSGKAIRVSL